MRKAEPDSTPEPSTAFERFERLARALFAVPKKEIDQKLAEYKQARPRKRKRG